MRKKLLAALLSVCIIVSMMVVPASASTFNDVSSDHWAASAIERWAGYEVLNGNGDGTFAPDRQMTRAEFASMLVNMLGLTKKSSTKFPDVPDNAWYADCISIAAAAGIITGDNGNAAPTRYISFNEAAVMLCRALGLAKTNVSGADWAKESIEKLTEMGAIGGSDTHLQAGADCNRAVVAALADKIVEQYVDEDTTITGQVKGVVLVVKGAKADIKDAVLSAPLVIESAEATLTNTTAQDVKVDGANSSVATDAKSAVAEVILGGEAPKADIKGTATAVTVAENATSAVVDAPASVEVKNESTSAITVNGETQEPTKTDDTNTTTTPEVTEGTSTPAHTHQWVYKPLSGADEGKHLRYCAVCGENATTATKVPCSSSYKYVYKDADSHYPVCTLCGESYEDPESPISHNATLPCVCGYTASIDVGNSDGLTPEQHTHVWELDNTAEGTKAATCTSTGVAVYKCTQKLPAASVEGGGSSEPSGGEGVSALAEGEGEDCTAVMTVTVPKLPHTYPEEGDAEWTAASGKAPTCTAAGYKTLSCTVCGGEPKNVTIPALAHVAIANPKASDYVKNATQHGLPCKNCGNTVAMDNHVWGAAESADAGKCTTCGYVCKHTATTATQVEGQTSTHNLVCDTCHKVVRTAAPCSFTSKKAGTGTAANCTTAGKAPTMVCACGNEDEGDEIPALGHDYSYTDTTDGHTGTCSRCNGTTTVTHQVGTDCDVPNCSWTKDSTKPSTNPPSSGGTGTGTGGGSSEPGGTTGGTTGGGEPSTGGSTEPGNG